MAEAVELINCSLLAAERAGEAPAGQRAALLGRFTEEQLASAYSFLVAKGQVYAGGISKAYALSDAFKAGLQVCPHIYASVRISLCRKAEPFGIPSCPRPTCTVRASLLP